MKNFTITLDGTNRHFSIALNATTRRFTIRPGVGPQGPQGIQGATGATGATGPQGAAGPNTVTSATTTNFTTGQVLYANGTNVGSLSRSGIDTRTSFPNDDVTAATESATPGTLVRRGILNAQIQVEGLESTGDFGAIGADQTITTKANFVFNKSDVFLSLDAAPTVNRTIYFPDEDGTLALKVSTAINEKIEMQGGGESGFVAPNYYAFGANSASLRDGNTGLACLTWGASGSQNLTVPSGTALTFDNTSFTYGAGAASAHRTALGLTALATTTPGTGVATALAVNVGSAGAFVVNGGALGTPSSGTLTSCTGLPISTGVSGLAANVATFLATPSSANLRAALTDPTGTGSNVHANSPTIVTPTIAQINVASSLLILGAGTSGLFGLRSNSATGYSSLELLNSSGTQMGGFGYGNASAGSYADQVYYYTNSRALILASFAGRRDFFLSTTGDVSIGSGAAANTRAVLDLTSTTKGFLPPRMTTTQRDAITSVPAGLMIYNTTTNKLNFYNGSAWEAVTSA